MDSIESLEADLDALMGLKDKVLAFPEEVTRECNIPVSTVAFIKGEFIHTNEFRIDREEEDGEDVMKRTEDEKDETQKYISHTQTAQILQDRISAIDAKLAKMGKKSVMKTNTTQVKTKKKDKHVSFDNADNVDSSMQSADNMKEMSSTAEAPANFFEIREFVDESGKEVRHEVVNLSDEMKDLKGVVDKLKEGGAVEDHSAIEDNDNNGEKNTGESDKKKALLDVLEANLKNFDMDGRSSSTPNDPELAFALETMQIQSQKAQNTDASSDLSDDFWDDLQNQEKRWNDMLNAKEGASWSKGFLNKKPKQSKQTIKKGGGGSGKEGKTSVASTASNTSFSEFTGKTKEPSRGSVRGTNMAFGDSILEKNI
jgi:hypothetical protein